MAFTVKLNELMHLTNGKLITGTYTNDGGSTGGDITLPLFRLNSLFLQPKGSAILANQPVVNETLPMEAKSSIAATIVTTANEVGTFIAIGL